MKTVLLVTPDSSLRARLQRAFPASSVFLAQSDAEALKTLHLAEIDAVFRDSRGGASDLGSFVSGAKEVRPAAIVVAVGSGDPEAVTAADLTLQASFTQRDLEAALRQLGEKRRMLGEIEALRARVSGVPAAEPRAESLIESPALAKTLREFSRVFTAGFDVPRAIEMFLDAMGELLRPARAALLLLDDSRQAYRVVAHRGLAPQIVQAVRLGATQGLCRWLAAQGRPARLQDLADPELLAELKLLGGVVAVPLLTHGELVGVLVVGPPVVGGMYGRQETEILFDLATHLGTAIRDITLHRHVEREKEFTEQILAHMSSGVVTIGRDERVGSINRRAEEILGLQTGEVIHQDLRKLPSPLGDMLFETVAYARALPKTEVHLAGRQLWLEVSTYPIHGAEGPPLGAVLVFEDRTAQKELAAQKRQANEFQLLARVIARIADEIKNPLVSVNTFVELIDERYDDPEFRKLFSSVVRRDVRRLVTVFEKLAGLVSEGELHSTIVDVHAVVDEVVTAIEVSDDPPGRDLELHVTRDEKPQPVRVDPPQFRRAVGYLVGYLKHHSPPGEARVHLAVSRHADREEGESVRVIVSSRSATVPAETLERLFDPVHMVQENLIEVGPAVSQRLIEAMGGRLQLRRGRHELAFQISLPPAV